MISDNIEAFHVEDISLGGKQTDAARWIVASPPYLLSAVNEDVHFYVSTAAERKVEGESCCQAFGRGASYDYQEIVVSEGPARLHFTHARGIILAATL
jgi:hypothetical protein